MQKKYMILCVAGQSNAVGYDESVIPADYCSRFDTGRIFQLGLYGDDNLKVISLGPCAQNFQDMRPFGNPANPGVGTRGIHLPLAHRLLKYIRDPENPANIDDFLIITYTKAAAAELRAKIAAKLSEHIAADTGCSDMRSMEYAAASAPL